MGEDGNLHELTTTASYSSSSSHWPTSWTVGPLDKMNISTDAKFLRACTPWNTSRDYGDIAPDLYLYYSSRQGPIKKLGWWNSQPSQWVALKDPPELNPRGFVECQKDFGSIENIWIVNDQNQLEQWSHVSSQTHNSTRRDTSIGDWTRGKQKQLVL